MPSYDQIALQNIAITKKNFKTATTDVKLSSRQLDQCWIGYTPHIGQWVATEIFKLVWLMNKGSPQLWTSHSAAATYRRSRIINKLMIMFVWWSWSYIQLLRSVQTTVDHNLINLHACLTRLFQHWCLRLKLKRFYALATEVSASHQNKPKCTSREIGMGNTTDQDQSSTQNCYGEIAPGRESRRTRLGLK